MTTILALLQDLISMFSSAGFHSPAREAKELLADLLDCSIPALYEDRFNQIATQIVTTSHSWAERRIGGEPLAYIHGRQEFYGTKIRLNRSVLIPRQETELLVDMIVQQLRFVDLKGKVLLDLCSGSGCIGIALKKALPELELILSDLSVDAMRLAAENCQINGVQAAILTGDLLAPLEGRKVDYLVCNPPYISEADYSSLDAEVKDFEPQMALLAGESGLEFYERLAVELPSSLNLQAKIWLEIGWDQGPGVLSLFSNEPWRCPNVTKDWSGHDRFFTCMINAHDA